MLKDRVTTAIELFEKDDLSPVAVLQVNDAESRLREAIDSNGIPFVRPNHISWSVLVIVVSVVVQFIPWSSESHAISEPIVRPTITADNLTRLEEAAEKAEELAEESSDTEVQDLANDLRDMIKTLKQPDTDLYRTLEEISDVQHKLEQHHDNLNIEQTDAQLKSLGEAMAGSPAFDKTAQALQNGDAEAAAEQLSNLNAEELEDADTDRIADNLTDVAGDMQKADMDELSESVSEMAKAAKDESATDMQAGWKSTGRATRTTRCAEDPVRLYAATEQSAV